MRKILTNKWLLGAILILIIANAIFTGFLWTRMHHKNPNHPPFMKERGAFLPAVLQFDSTQERQFKHISEKHFAKMDTLKSMEFMWREKLYATVDSLKLDTAIMQDISSQLTSVQQQIHQQTLFHFREIRAICKKEQVQKLKELMHGSVMRDMGPARFLRAIPNEIRDSILKQHPDWKPEMNRQLNQNRNINEPVQMETYPPGPPHRQTPPPHDGHCPLGPPPHERDRPNGPPPPFEGDMPPPPAN